jgi:hypothetical protein
MLRLRWTLLRAASCTDWHIVIVHPLVALGVPWNHEQSFFFLAGLFLKKTVTVVTVKKKEEWSECCLQVDTPNAEAAGLGCIGLRAPLIGAGL